MNFSFHVRYEGEDLLRRSRRLLDEAESLGERAGARPQDRASGVLRVGASPQVIENQLVDFLAQYRRRHPAVEVNLLEDGGGRLPSRLERGDVQLAIMPGGDERFHGRLLSPNYLLAVLTDCKIDALSYTSHRAERLKGPEHPLSQIGR